MSVLESCRELIRVTLDHSSSEDQFDAAAELFLGNVQQASPPQVAAAASELAELFHKPHLPERAFVGVLCGTMVEHGLDPQPFAKVLLPLLEKWLSHCVQFYDRLRATASTSRQRRAA